VALVLGCVELIRFLLLQAKRHYRTAQERICGSNWLACRAKMVSD
jgi:hypothetical protein